MPCFKELVPEATPPITVLPMLKTTLVMRPVRESVRTRSQAHDRAPAGQAALAEPMNTVNLASARYDQATCRSQRLLRNRLTRRRRHLLIAGLAWRRGEDKVRTRSHTGLIVRGAAESVNQSSRQWRRERDSNPRDGCPPTRVPGVRLRPLGHLSIKTSRCRGSGRRKAHASPEMRHSRRECRVAPSTTRPPLHQDLPLSRKWSKKSARFSRNAALATRMPGGAFDQFAPYRQSASD